MMGEDVLVAPCSPERNAARFFSPMVNGMTSTPGSMPGEAGVITVAEDRNESLSL